MNGGLPLPLIAKYDNKMKLLWQQNVLTSNYPSSNPPIIFYGLAAVTDGSVYVVGQMQGSTGYCYSGCTSYAFQAPATGTPITWTPNTTGPTPFIVKYGSDGTPQWVNSIYDNTSGMNASGIASGSFYNVSVDSGNSPVAVGEMSAPPNSYCSSYYNSSYTTPFFSNTQITSSSYYYNNPGTIASISSCSAKNILAAGFDVNGNNKWSTSASYTSNNCSYCSSPTTDPTVYSYFSDVKISGSTLYAVGNMREPTSSNMNNMGGGPPAGMLLFGNNTAQVPVSITPNLTGSYSLSTNWNAFLVSYDLSIGQPSPQWVTQPYRTSSDNRFVSIGIDGQSNIYATGQIGSQAMKVKYDLSGNVLSTKLGVSSGTSSVSFYYGIGLDAITNKEYGYGLYNYTPTDDGTQPGGVFDFLGTTPSGSSNFFRQFLW
jgi:hypothetical protein